MNLAVFILIGVVNVIVTRIPFVVKVENINVY